jgi:hypothetical protein
MKRLLFSIYKEADMRSDMPKVIVERPRVIHFGGGKNRPLRELEDYPRHEGMRRRHQHYGSKILTDHIKPLRRYLDKQVGRPWCKVYSEICAIMRFGNALHDHLRKHARDYVAVDGPYPAHDRNSQFQPFYVDPRTGILRRRKNPK